MRFLFYQRRNIVSNVNQHLRKHPSAHDASRTIKGSEFYQLEIISAWAHQTKGAPTSRQWTTAESKTDLCEAPYNATTYPMLGYGGNTGNGTVLLAGFWAGALIDAGFIDFLNRSGNCN